MRHRRRRDIIIELTSLLDVIMIIIFMVMTENSKLITEKQSALEAAQLENIEKDDKIEDLSGKLNGLEAELDEALGKLGEGSLEDLIERLAEAESRLESYEYMDEIVFVINVGLENRYNNTVRYLSFGSRSDSEQSLCEIRNDIDLNTAINRLKVFVTEYISKISSDDTNSTIVYVVFSYDTHNVYQDDYAAVDEALKNVEIRANSGNFRYHCNPL
ncbi:MAG: hypothetical protein J1F03_05700 [Oscillospiraceae bacterium]|nr:hypothetical protein [Oscillospiraceae bacterium]